MKKKRFEIGDMIISKCGDKGLVLKVGPRPDDGIGKMGVYAHWVNENLSFWMDIDEPQLKLYAESKKENRYEC